MGEELISSDTSRFYLAIFLAALLPIVLFASAIALILGFREQETLQASALSKVREITAGIDQFIANQREAAEIMARANSLQRDDLAGFYAFASNLKSQHPAWVTVVLADATGNPLLNIARPFGAPLDGSSDLESLRRVLDTRAPVIGNLAEPGAGTGKIFIAIRAPFFEGDTIKYIVSIALDPTQLNSLFATADVPADWVGAVVDRNGNLLARSAMADAFVGKKANPAALEAIKQQSQGLYEGRTLEGRSTVFVFHTSPLTGWSVHYGVPKSSYAAPLRDAFGSSPCA